MKQVIIIILIIAFGSSCVAQNGVSTAFNINQTQFNYALNYTRDFGKHHTVGLGFKILHKINNTPTTPDAPDNLKHGFKHRFYPNQFSEFFGIDFNYHFTFEINNSGIKPFIFYNFQYTYSSILNDAYIYHFTPDFYFLCKIDEVSHSLWAYEQNIGIGFNIKITDNLDFFSRVGAGILIHDNDGVYIFSEGWEISTMFGNGFIYKF